ncbi:Protein of unknown function [Gryllus bimaculatus]|nr:Protein of unknown function [Gryllus bimaculatus]
MTRWCNQKECAELNRKIRCGIFTRDDTARGVCKVLRDHHVLRHLPAVHGDLPHGEYDARFPHAMMSVLAASGALACSFLPETLHQQLPETLADAHRFGTDQRYWQFRYRPRPSARDAPEKKPPHAHKEGVS